MELKAQLASAATAMGAIGSSSLATLAALRAEMRTPEEHVLPRVSRCKPRTLLQ